VSILYFIVNVSIQYGMGGSAAEWLACWTKAQKGLGSNRSRDAQQSSMGYLFYFYSMVLRQCRLVPATCHLGPTTTTTTTTTI